MVEFKYVRPKKGLRVIHETTKQPLPAVGRRVGWSTYWDRRLRDGDISLMTKPEVAELQKKQEEQDAAKKKALEKAQKEKAAKKKEVAS